jgi:CheY-like chemotaxis protein
VETQEVHSSERLILLVEDNPDDELLVKRTFERAGLKHLIYSVHSGQDAIAYLKGYPPFNDREKFPIPDLVLLDIKLPGNDGFDVLRTIRQDWMPWHLPVVMLTASDEIQDANQAYKLGANSFLVKPLDFENAHELACSLDRVLEGVHP